MRTAILRRTAILQVFWRHSVNAFRIFKLLRAGVVVVGPKALAGHKSDLPADELRRVALVACSFGPKLLLGRCGTDDGSVTV